MGFITQCISNTFIMNFLRKLFCKKEIDFVKVVNNSEEKPRTIADRLCDSYSVQSQVEDLINELFEEHEPEIYEILEFHMGADWYDNSIEIYFDVSLPYPYEPCKEIREAIYKLGFSIVYWNFLKDTAKVMCDRFIGKEPSLVETYDEVRGYEPRHYRLGQWKPTKYGYVDKRFNEKEWKLKYYYEK